MTIVTLYRRLQRLWKRKRNAALVGLHFTRAKTIKLPDSLVINGNPTAVHLTRSSSTNGAFADIFLDDCYGLLNIKSRGGEIKTIVDVGANQGLFMLHARNTFATAAIFGYEPNPEVRAYLKVNASKINAHIFSEAVGLENHHVRFRDGADSLHGKIMPGEEGDTPQISIRECIRRANGTIDILKLDCEGSEWEILQDHSSMAMVKILTLEYHLDDEHFNHHKRDHQAITRLIESNNFQIIHQHADAEFWGVIWAINRAHHGV